MPQEEVRVEQRLDIAQLYPNLSPEQLVDAEQSFDTYVEQTLFMFERIRRHPEDYRTFRKLINRPIANADPSIDNPAPLSSHS